MKLTNDGQPHVCGVPALHNNTRDEVSICDSCLLPVDRDSRVIICLAGDRRQFENWRRSAFRIGSTLIYGDFPDKIQGIRADEVVVIGTFWERKDAKKLYDLAQTRIYGKPRKN